MMKRRTASALALSAIATASVVLAAPGASADLVTQCVGTGGPVTLPTDLVVPAGKSCSLDGTTITGNVRVAAGANLVINGGKISGELRVAADGYLDATNTTVNGQVVLAAGGFGLYLRDTTTGRVVVQPKGEATVEGFLFAEGATVEGNVTSGVGEVRLDGSEITGSVNTTGAYYTDLHDSFVDGTLSVLNNATGSVVCGSAVQGKSTFAGNLGGVQLGPNGALDSCDSGGYFARDVSITNTTGRVTLDDNIINGQLVVNTNNPAAEVAANNKIRGGVVGEQAGAAAAAKALAAPDRVGADQRAQDRLAAAAQAATTAGKARL
jgi:hypothetical protein